jgi:hypothetical protein
MWAIVVESQNVGLLLGAVSMAALLLLYVAAGRVRRKQTSALPEKDESVIRRRW